MKPPVSHPPDPTRRRFLVSALVGVLAGRVGLAMAERPGYTAGSDTAPHWLLRIIDDRATAGRFGRAYLEAHPAEQDVGRLSDALDEAVPRLQEDLDIAERQSLFTALDHAIREDYLHGRLVRVDGWLLSRSEARVYALVALL